MALPPLGLFRGPRVASRMRTGSFALILVASLALHACGPRDQDKLGENELAGPKEARKAAAPDTRCAAQGAQDEVKRQLFARAAEIRGANSDAYARIAGFALLQLDGVAPDISAAASHSAECRARATLRLPPGLKVAGGRTTLGGGISYSIAPGARGAVTLGQSDAIAIPLATLTQSRPAPPAPEPAPTTDEPLDPLAPAPVPVETSTAGRPSFNCRSANTQGERFVCDNPTLAALDRTMAAQYRGALARADSSQRQLLLETRDRFLAFRDRCPSDSCIDRAYRGRMREIDDIMAGRWQGRIYRN